MYFNSEASDNVLYSPIMVGGGGGKKRKALVIYFWRWNIFRTLFRLQIKVV
jgi:hypothetical protein